jgi:hypothetical protein
MMNPLQQSAGAVADTDYSDLDFTHVSSSFRSNESRRKLLSPRWFDSFNGQVLKTFDIIIIVLMFVFSIVQVSDRLDI